MVENEDGKLEPAPDSVELWARRAGVHKAAAEGLRSKLTRLFNRPYLKNAPASNGLSDITNALESGRHVVLSFGNYQSDLDYLLVTNLITRKIRDTWGHQRLSQQKTPNRARWSLWLRKPTNAQPRDGFATIFSTIAGIAQMLRHPADHRPTPVANLRRGHVPAARASPALWAMRTTSTPYFGLPVGAVCACWRTPAQGRSAHAWLGRAHAHPDPLAPL